MHLSSIEIKNFRSLESLRVDLQSGLNVLVGRNNTGKTNLLEAIRHALGPSASRGDALWLEREDFFRESPDDNKERTIGITLTFSNLSEAQRAHFFEIVDFNMADIAASTAVLSFEASWPKGRRQATIRRYGGSSKGVDTVDIPASILESIPVTFLPALRDAEASMAPGHRSRLALLLRDIASRVSTGVEGEIVQIYRGANQQLEEHKLIRDTVASLEGTTKQLAGTDHSSATINTAAAEFASILRTLQVQMKIAPVGDLSANGLGMNNLLYMAVVLEHLTRGETQDCPLLLVEEPEAHLHPQLTMLLTDYLGAKGRCQTLVTTHSPTLAASVQPSHVSLLFSDPHARKPRCNSVRRAGLSPNEEEELQRMMDVTRATLYFAKGAILVEGISEALLVPVFAKRMGHDLLSKHVSVIPICGVAFETFRKLLQPSVFGIRVAFMTDADPEVQRMENWEDETPAVDGTKFKLCDRTIGLSTLFANHETVNVVHSLVTLEYDLAIAGDGNAQVLTETWEACFTGKPGTLNQKRLSAALTREEKALTVWRGICRASPTVGKAEFAHKLAARLSKRDENGAWSTAFEVPEYIKRAIDHVVSAPIERRTAVAVGE